MSWLMNLILILIATAVVAWVFRFAGQKFTRNKPFFRDMPFAVAFGYVAGLLVLIAAVSYYFRPVEVNGVPSAGVIFFRWAVQGFIGFAIAAYLFRLFGRAVGTAGTRKLFRAMPLTAAFGVLVILLYAIVSIFAGSIAPYGQEEIFANANIVPGGNPMMGGDPNFPLGTDQIGRDIYSRLIYGAQNTVGIAFATTCLAFFVGGSLGFLAAIVGGWLDQILSRAVDVLMAIPALIFALLLMTIASVWSNQLGVDRTIFMVLIIAMIDSTRVYRLSRAVGQNIVVMDYIEAAKLRGEGMGYLIFKEILAQRNGTAFG